MLTTSHNVSLASLIAEQLSQIESALETAATSSGTKPDERAHSTEIITGPVDTRATQPDCSTILNRIQALQRQFNRLLFLNECMSAFGIPQSLADVTTQLMDALWQRHQFIFAGLVLGESELGPYFYHDLRGVLDARRYLHKQCPLPLWGELAHALVRRLDPEEPDYLFIPDIADAGRPTLDEFPWMPRSCALVILPLRKETVAIGALILGIANTEDFIDIELRYELAEFAATAAHAIISAQAQEEIHERAEQLVGLQLFTRSLAAVTSFDRLIGIIVNGVIELMGASSTLLVFQSTLIGAGLREHLLAASGVFCEQELVCIAAKGEAPTLFTRLNRILQWMIDAAQPLFLDPSQPLESPENLYYNETGRALLAPITVGENSLGALYIEASPTRSGYDEEDMVVLRTAINAIAIVLQQIG